MSTGTAGARSAGPSVVLLGMLGRSPFAGIALQVLHYIEGLARLGYEVYYVEDTGEWPYDPLQNSITDNCSYTVRYIDGLMERIGKQACWAYRSGVDGQVYNMPDSKLRRVLDSADALINLSGATVLTERHMGPPIRIYLETDPVLPQIETVNGLQSTIAMLDAHTHHFTFGENIGRPHCGVPVGRYRYRAARQPIILDWWDPATHPFSRLRRPERYTTIANWKQTGKDFVWKGEKYTWSKDVEFTKFIDLPGRSHRTFELALACGDEAARSRLRAHGWRVVDALPLSRELDPYMRYIFGSSAEFTVAKDQNVRLRSGWFSDRSASYLAAGKPVITQDTGFDSVLPTGMGLFTFLTIDDVMEALDAIESDYARQSEAAREIAAEFFSAETVLADMMAQVGLSAPGSGAPARPPEVSVAGRSECSR